MIFFFPFLFNGGKNKRWKRKGKEFCNKSFTFKESGKLSSNYNSFKQGFGVWLFKGFAIDRDGRERDNKERRDNKGAHGLSQRRPLRSFNLFLRVKQN